VVWHGFKIKAVIISLVIGLICLFGGQWLYGKYGYQQSLQQALERHPQVAGFKAAEQGGKIAVTVRLKSASNLMVNYKEIEHAVTDALGSRPFILRLDDNRDASLEAAFYRSQFVIYQALAQGSFKDMESEVSEHARAVGASAQIYLDNENVYLAFNKGDRFLAAVVPRNPPQEAKGGAVPYA
jgi:hypothetical protein